MESAQQALSYVDLHAAAVERPAAGAAVAAEAVYLR
jgi:hypothetical protein